MITNLQSFEMKASTLEYIIVDAQEMEMSADGYADIFNLNFIGFYFSDGTEFTLGRKTQHAQRVSINKDVVKITITPGEYEIGVITVDYSDGSKLKLHIDIID